MSTIINENAIYFYTLSEINLTQKEIVLTSSSGSDTVYVYNTLDDYPSIRSE